MLDIMRRKAKSIYIQAIIVVIILVFVFWGVNSAQKGGPGSIATVNDQSISAQDFQQTYQQTINQYQEQFGGALPPELLETLDMKQQVLNQMIQELVMLQGAREAGLIVSGEELRTVIQNMDAFRENGVFSLDRYKTLLAASKTNATDFENKLRDDLLRDKVLKHISRFVRISDGELKERHAFDNDQLKLEYVAFKADDFRKSGPVPDEELNPFFAERKDAYLTEPQVKLKYLIFSEKQALADTQLTDQEIEQYYTMNTAKFTTPEQRRARHILLRSGAGEQEGVKIVKRKKLETILELAKTGEDFSKLAKEHSEDASRESGGDLGFFSKEEMVPPFAEAAFALKEGEISGVVETQFGFHLIKLEKIKPASVTPLAAVREEIIKEIKGQRGKELTFQLANQAYEGIVQAGSLDKYAATAAVEVQTTDFFPHSNPPASLSGQPALLATIFSLKKGELSSLLEIKDGYAIIFVDEAKEPQVPPLAEVRARVEKDFLNMQANTLAKEAATALLEQAKKETALSAAAEKTGNSVLETSYFTRSLRETSGLPAPVAEQGLKLSAASPYPKEIAQAGGTFYVLHFKEAKPAGEEAFASQKETLLKSLTQEKQMQILGAWLAYLQNRAKITSSLKDYQ